MCVCDCVCMCVCWGSGGGKGGAPALVGRGVCRWMTAPSTPSTQPHHFNRPNKPSGYIPHPNPIHHHATPHLHSQTKKPPQPHPKPKYEKSPTQINNPTPTQTTQTVPGGLVPAAHAAAPARRRRFLGGRPGLRGAPFARAGRDVVVPPGDGGGGWCVCDVVCVCCFCWGGGGCAVWVVRWSWRRWGGMCGVRDNTRVSFVVGRVGRWMRAGW
jgi:hypothetical protein